MVCDSCMTNDTNSANKVFPKTSTPTLTIISRAKMVQNIKDSNPVIF
jgi:hypothetical protein